MSRYADLPREYPRVLSREDEFKARALPHIYARLPDARGYAAEFLYQFDHDLLCDGRA